MAGVRVLKTAAGLPVQEFSPSRPHRRAWRGGLHGSEFTWAVAFVIPYAALFVAFVAYPVVYGLWLGHEPKLYAELLSDPIYQRTVFGIDGPGWLETSRWLALGSVIASHIWKWMPFWTVILLAGRMAIPQELYEAAEMDGATGLRRFVHLTFPLLANLYLICTLLSTLFTLGDFNSVFFVSGGGPALSTHVLATLGIRDAFEVARPELGVAAVMSALPLMIPLVILLMRKLRTTEVQL
jgi:ABC-type sugar transport system permease subunit